MSGQGYRSYIGALGANPVKKEVVMYIGGLVLAAFLITNGALLINDEAIIKDLDNSKTSVLNNTLGSITVVVGSLLVLYLLFRFFTTK
jgi:hypothetical protein